MQRGEKRSYGNPQQKTKKWWHDAVTYEVYVPSFCDANGDGIGDLRGVTSKLEYLAQLGIDCIWLTPIMKSPFADCGYDVSDYCSINPVFGTMEDFDELLRKTHEQGMKLILDVVFGHTSDKHPWFQQAASSRQSPKHTYYVWKDPVNGGPPNNWYQGCMCGPAWTYVKEVDQYYYHAFVKDQPQLNWANPEVQEEIYRVIRFWLDKGIDGFRLDAINFLFCEDDFRDNPGEGRAQRRVVNLNQAGIHAIVQKMRSIADEYGDIMMVGEVYPGSTDEGRLYYGNSNNELTQAFNFTFLHTVKEYSTYKDEWGQLQQTADFHREEISLATKLMEMWRYNEQTFRALELWPTVVLGNHDQPRISSVLEGLGEETYRDRLDRIAPYYTFTLKGSPFLYYGEELGMHSIMPDSIDKIRDMHGRYFYDHLVQVDKMDPQEALKKTGNVARDHCRQAMAWDATQNGGFSSGKELWAPLPPDWQTNNVKRQLEDPNSLLALYRQLMQLRRAKEALRGGDYIWPESRKDCLLFARRADNDYAVVAINVSQRRLVIDLQAEGLTGPLFAHRVLQSTGCELRENTLTIEPFACAILE